MRLFSSRRPEISRGERGDGEEAVGEMGWVRHLISLHSVSVGTSFFIYPRRVGSQSLVTVIERISYLRPGTSPTRQDTVGHGAALRPEWLRNLVGQVDRCRAAAALAWGADARCVNLAAVGLALPSRQAGSGGGGQRRRGLGRPGIPGSIGARSSSSRAACRSHASRALLP